MPCAPNNYFSRLNSNSPANIIKKAHSQSSLKITMLLFRLHVKYGLLLISLCIQQWNSVNAKSAHHRDL